MTKVKSIYARFEAFEEQLAHCYHLLHERFIDNPPLAKFWAESAMEEMDHSSMLRFCQEKHLMSEIGLDVEAADHIEQLLETVNGIVNNSEVSVSEAFYASLLMESSELDEIYEKLTRTLAKDHRLLYGAIRASLRSHHDRFADGASMYCGDAGLTEAFRMLGRSLRLNADGAFHDGVGTSGTLMRE